MKGDHLKIDASHIASTRSQLARIIRDFPRALPRLVGDVEAWSGELSEALRRVEGALSSEEGARETVPPASQDRSARHALLTALGWQPQAREVLVRAKVWLTEVGDELEAIFAVRVTEHGPERGHEHGLELLLHLFELASEHGEDVMQPLLVALGDPQLVSAVGVEAPGADAERTRLFVLDLLVMRFVAEPTAIRERALRLVLALLPLERASESDRWKAAIVGDNWDSVARDVRAALKKVPQLAARPRLFQSMLDCLGQAPCSGRDHHRTRLFLGWAYLLVDEALDEKSLIKGIAAEARWLARELPLSVRWLPWARTHYRRRLEVELLLGMPSWRRARRMWGVLLDALFEVIGQELTALGQSSPRKRRRHKQESLFEKGWILLAAAPNIELGVERIRAIVDAGQAELASSYSDEDLRALVWLAQDHPGALPRLVVQVRSWSRFWSEAMEDLLTGSRLSDVDREGLREAFLYCNQKKALELCRAESLCWKLRLDPAAPPQDQASDSGWWDTWPVVLRPLLAELDALLPGAEAKVRRLLGPAFRDTSSVQGEVRALKQRLTTASGSSAENMRRRLDALVSRGTESLPNLDDLAWKRVQGKLRARRALARAELRIAAIRAATLGAVPVHFRAAIKLAEVDDRARRVLHTILGLQKEYRDLGLRLFCARAGEPPWDQRDDEANVAFLESLEGLGINLEPWLEGKICEVEAPSGEVLRLGIERDPLEVLLMGHHFSTCLTPGHMNFWSAVVNAADVNKQVVYARTRDGRVVGRQLLALTDEGHLVAFHAYAHDKGLDFTAMASRFVMDLAEAMGTESKPLGEISALLASDWYDDGPIELRKEWRFLSEDEFRKQLWNLKDPDLVLPLLESQRPMAEWDGMALGRVVGGLSCRQPNLVQPLLPWITRADLSVLDRIRVAQHLACDGDLDGARRFLAGFPITRRRVRNLDYSGRWILTETLLRVDPEAALKVLRWTTARGLRPEDTRDPGRLRHWAQAFEATHRAARAAGLRAKIEEANRAC